MDSDFAYYVVLPQGIWMVMFDDLETFLLLPMIKIVIIAIP